MFGACSMGILDGGMRNICLHIMQVLYYILGRGLGENETGARYPVPLPVLLRTGGVCKESQGESACLSPPMIAGPSGSNLGLNQHGWNGLRFPMCGGQ